VKAIIKYSSGTGNTKYIASETGRQLIEAGYIIDISDIETETNFDDFDILIIGGPIYAGNVPEKLIRYVLRKVPSSRGKKAIVFTTSTGLLNAHGVLSLSNKLNKKGFDVVSNEKFILPRNYYFGHYSPMDDTYCKNLFNDAKKQISKLVESITSNNFTRPEIIIKGIIGKDLLAELFAMMAKFMGKSYSVNQNCTLCMKCIKNCPQNNIYKDDSKIQYKFNCMMCTRCIHGCPANAIEYSKKSYKQYSPLHYLT